MDHSSRDPKESVPQQPRSIQSRLQWTSLLILVFGAVLINYGSILQEQQEDLQATHKGFADHSVYITSSIMILSLVIILYGLMNAIALNTSIIPFSVRIGSTLLLVFATAVVVFQIISWQSIRHFLLDSDIATVSATPKKIKQIYEIAGSITFSFYSILTCCCLLLAFFLWFVPTLVTTAGPGSPGPRTADLLPLFEGVAMQTMLACLATAKFLLVVYQISLVYNQGATQEFSSLITSSIRCIFICVGYALVCVITAVLAGPLNYFESWLAWTEFAAILLEAANNGVIISCLQQLETEPYPVGEQVVLLMLIPRLSVLIVHMFRFRITLSRGLRKLVSQKKYRYTHGGFDLDLSYITPRIIAMACPADGVKSAYRNPVNKVAEFFELRHSGMYRIYNLCSESSRTYDASLFENVYSGITCPDHNPVELAKFVDLLEDMDGYLKSDVNGVAAVHCKAGKGRTGMVISGYLLWSSQCTYAEEALALFDERRTFNKKGVTVPSQRRYVRYIEQCRREEQQREKKEYHLKELILTSVPNMKPGGCAPGIKIESANGVRLIELPYVATSDDTSQTVDVSDLCIKISGDVNITFFDMPPTARDAGEDRKAAPRPNPVDSGQLSRYFSVGQEGWSHSRFFPEELPIPFMKPQKLFHFWIHTSYLDCSGCYTSTDDGLESLVLESKDLDFYNKEKRNAHCKNDFTVELIFSVVGDDGRNNLGRSGHNSSMHPTAEAMRRFNACSNDESDVSEHSWDDSEVDPLLVSESPILETEFYFREQIPSQRNSIWDSSDGIEAHQRPDFSKYVT